MSSHLIKEGVIMRLLFCLSILFVNVACNSSAQQIETQLKQFKEERRALKRIPVNIETPANYDKADLANGTIYDHKPRVVVTDEKAGKYEFRWIGLDKKEKIIKYQRLGAIDVLVSATVQKDDSGVRSYKYTVENLPTSVNNLTGYIVQNFAAETKPIEFDFDNSYIGPMSNLITGFKEGKWWRYAILDSHLPAIVPGSKIELQLRSSALPGLVECKADGGKFGMQGVGEDMPPELERLTLGNKDLPYGYTIGPIDKLLTMNRSERAKYVLENLSKFQEAGWMSSGTAAIYKSILEKEDLAGALAQAQKDVEKEFITSEVFHIIEGLNF